MRLQSGFKTSWICLLFFSIVACAPRKGQTGAGYYYGGSGGGGSSSSGGAAFGFGSVFSAGGVSSGAGSSVDSEAAQDNSLSQMIAAMLSLGPAGDRSFLQTHWRSQHVPVQLVAPLSVNPSSLVVHTNSGYQRARDLRSNSRYLQDAVEYIPQPGTPQDSGSGSKGHQKF